MRPPRPRLKDRRVPAGNAFTLIELLVVIGIIALLSGLAMPIFHKRTGNEMAAANRQLLDDLAFARQKAIVERTTVYVVFVPTNFWLTTPFYDTNKLYTNLIGDQLTGYALFTPRSAGDQPGQPVRRYVTEWKSLPDQIYFPDWKFTNGATVFFPPDTNNNPVPVFVDPFPYLNVGENLTPFAVEQSIVFTHLPYVAFNSLGRLVLRTNGTVIDASADVLIPLARGSIFDPPRDAGGNFTYAVADFIESPPGNSSNNPNLIRINHLTGRARIERPELR